MLLGSTGLLANSAYTGDLFYVRPAIVGTLALAFYSANIHSAVNVAPQGNQPIVVNEVAWYRERSIIRRLAKLDLEPGVPAP